MANNAHALAGLGVTDPNNSWSPYGPFPTLKHVVLQYYDSDASEFAAFQAGGTSGIDIAEFAQSGTGPPASDWPTYDANPDWNMSGLQGGSTWDGMYFNGASSTWGFWGCNWQYYNSACGVEMRQAFAHLINRPDFNANFFGSSKGASTVWDDVPNNKLIANTGVAPYLGQAFASPSSNFCHWDTIDNTGCTSSTGPYVVGGLGSTAAGFPAIPSGAIAGCPAGNTNPTAWSGCTNDFALSAEHMVVAGIASGMDPVTYQIGAFLTHSAGIAAHPLRDCVRSTNPRRTFGTGFDTALNNLFGVGGATASPKVTSLITGNIVVCGFDRAFTEISTPVDDWDMYTYGYSDGGPFPTYLLTQFSTKFTFTGIDGAGLGPTWCGGTAASHVDQPTNPTFTCLDGRTGAGITTALPACTAISPTGLGCTTRNNQADAPITTAVTTTAVQTTFDDKIVLNSGSALDVLGQNVASIPVLALNTRVPALRSVVGETNTKGLSFGSTAIFTLVHDNTAYTPTNPAFRFDGGLSTTDVRWGQAQPTTYLNPYNAATVWEFNTLGLVYDAVFSANPVAPTQVYGEMAQTYSQGPSTACPFGTSAVTTFCVELRNNLEFQDGTRATARDVAFSLLTLRDQSTVLSGGLGLLQSVTLSSTDPLSLVITMTGQSVSHIINLSGIPILPLARWACPSNGISSINPALTCNPNLYTTSYTLAGVPAGVQGSPAGTTIADCDPAKCGGASAAYDPVVDNNFLGSGPFMCTNSAGTTIGGGCTSSGTQELNPGDSADLTSYNRVIGGPAGSQFANLQLNDPFAQFVHSDDPNWSTYATSVGFTAVTESGQQQEFSYAQHSNVDQVTLTDETEAENNCFHAVSTTSQQGPNHLLCPNYNYWLRNTLHPGTTGTISSEVDVVNSHYGDLGVGPFQWAAGNVGSGPLTNVVAFPGNCAATGSTCPP